MRPWNLLKQLHEQGWLVAIDGREVRLKKYTRALSPQLGYIIVSYGGHGDTLEAMLENAVQKMREGEGLQPTP